MLKGLVLERGLKFELSILKLTPPHLTLRAVTERFLKINDSRLCASNEVLNLELQPQAQAKVHKSFWA